MASHSDEHLLEGQPAPAPVVPRKLGGTLYLDTPYATMARRTTAWLLDVAIWVGVYLVLTVAAAGRSSGGTDLLVLLGVVTAAFAYWWLMTGLTGQTLGKKATKIRVVRVGAPNARFGLGTSFGRCALFVGLFGVPMGQLVNVLLMAGDAPENRGIHDRAVDSRVVRTQSKLADPTWAPAPQMNSLIS